MSSYGDGGFYFLQPVGRGQGYAGIQFGAAPMMGGGALSGRIGTVGGAASSSEKKTDVMPAPAGATDKTHPANYTSFKGVVVHRRPLFIAKRADLDAWLVWLANKLEEVRKNRNKDSDAIKAKEAKIVELKKGLFTDKEKAEVTSLEKQVRDRKTAVKAHDIRKEYYSATIPYVRDLWDRISKAATPEEKVKAAAAAVATQQTKDTTAGPALTAEETKVAAEETTDTSTVGGQTATAAPPAEEQAEVAPAAAPQTVSDPAAAPAEESFIAKYGLYIGLGVVALGAGYYFTRD